MVQEFYDDNTTFYWSWWLKKFVDNYTWWLKYLKKCEKDDTWEEKIVPGIQYILVHEPNNSVIWFINSRLRLNADLLEHGGHIGYSIRPCERRKHYATAQLFSVLKFYKNLWIEKVLLTCDKSNIWSAKTIQNCWWILENEIIDPTDWELIQRYWIDVNEWIEKWNKFFENNNFDVKLI
jgi:predicted acetyltransferase